MSRFRDQRRVLLVNPPFPRKSLRGAPLSQLYLAGSLRDPSIGFRGECRILDLNISENPGRDLAREISEFRPTHVGVTRYSPNAREGMRITRTVKETNPAIVTMVGGPHEVFCGRNTLKQFGSAGEGIVDYVVSGFDGIGGFHRALGIDSARTVFDIGPAHDMLTSHPKYQFEGLFEGRMTQLMTSVGCPYTCAFCHHDFYQPMKVDKVIQTVENILSMGFRAIVFDDLNFATSKKRTQELIRRFGELDFEWGCQTRADGVSEQLLERMRNAGCTYICYGLETGDDSALASPELQKRMTLESIRNAVVLSKKFGINVGLYAMFGHAAEMENPETARATVDAIEEFAPRFLSISFYAVYPSFQSPQDLMDGYEQGTFSQDTGWLAWDEGWGAYHPHCDLAYAKGIEARIQERIRKSAEIWGRIRRF